MMARVGLLCAVLLVSLSLTAGTAAPHAQAQPQSSLTTILASPASPDSDPDMPTWPLAVGVIIAVGIAAIWQVRRSP